jgi:hypothetical protein
MALGLPIYNYGKYGHDFNVIHIKYVS